MWIVGLQFLCWTLGGLYFSLFDIHFIHGESLLKSPDKVDLQKVNYGFAQVLNDYPEASNIKIYALDNKPYIQFVTKTPAKQGQSEAAKHLIDASTGKAVTLIDKAQAEKLALLAYSGSGKILDSRLIETDPPFELWQGHLPVWRIDFNEFGTPSLYISQITGEVVTKRHVWWRAFDLFWRLHIMDILEGENVKNRLLTVAAVLAMITALAGAVLTWYLVVSPWLKLKNKFRNSAKVSFYRRWHRRSSVLVAIQMVIWIATGMYFNLMDSQWYSTRHYLAEQEKIECHLIATDPPALNLLHPPVYLELLRNVQGCYVVAHYKRVFRQYQKMQAQIFDVNTGREMLPIASDSAISIAQASYNGPGTVQKATLLQAGESSNSKQQNPVWQVDFDDAAGTSVYVHSVTREVIRHENHNSRFHRLMFKLHFMDYFNTGGFSHWLLKLFAFMALFLTLTGVYWLCRRFFKR